MSYKIGVIPEELYGQAHRLLDEEFGTDHIDLHKYLLLGVYKGLMLYGVVMYLEYHDCIDIHYITVDKEFRRKGIGSKLITTIKEYCKKTGKYIILTPCKTQNVLRFYEKHGFDNCVDYYDALIWRS